MKPIVSTLVLLALAGTPCMAKKRPEQTCKVSFGFYYIDHLDNPYRGIQGKQLKQVQDKLGKYGDVCYTNDDQNADYIFFVHTKPATYHGVQTSSNTTTNTDTTPVSGSITDQDGNRSTYSGTADTTTRTTTTTSTPYEVDYSIFLLDIMIPQKKEGSAEKTFTKLHTFEQKGFYNTIYGIGYGKGKNPIVNVIDEAAKWLHENNLGK
jgi:hypothetical protein